MALEFQHSFDKAYHLVILGLEIIEHHVHWQVTVEAFAFVAAQMEGSGIWRMRWLITTSKQRLITLTPNLDIKCDNLVKLNNINL